MGGVGRAVVTGLCAVTAVVASHGSAGAQAEATISILPAVANPGGIVTVANGSGSPCPPPSGTDDPSVSVDIFAAGLATPINRAPFQGIVAPTGLWSVPVQLAPDLPPGTYRIQAGCYTDSGLNARFGPSYADGRLDIRLADPGQPSAAPRSGRPGETIQVGSSGSPCPPPTGSPSPRVRVSLKDDTGATRAEAEGTVDMRTGGWSLGLRVPDLGAQTAELSAVCLARVGAPAPYARYSPIAFTIERAPDVPTTTTPTTTGATTVPSVTVPGATTTSPPTTSQARTLAAALPPAPIATAVVAEPTYTG